MEPSEESNAPMGIGLIPRWHHVDCFVEEREDLEVDSSITAECFTGFNKLEKADQDTLKKKLGASKEKKKSAGKGKKRKVEEEEKPQKKQKTSEEEAEEKALKVHAMRKHCLDYEKGKGCEFKMEIQGQEQRPSHTVHTCRL